MNADPTQTEAEAMPTAADLFASGFDLGALRKRINSSIAKAKFMALPKAERDKRATEAFKIIKQLLK